MKMLNGNNGFSISSNIYQESQHRKVLLGRRYGSGFSNHKTISNMNMFLNEPSEVSMIIFECSKASGFALYSTNCYIRTTCKVQLTICTVPWCPVSDVTNIRYYTLRMFLFVRQGS